MRALRIAPAAIRPLLAVLALMGSLQAAYAQNPPGFEPPPRPPGTVGPAAPPPSLAAPPSAPLQLGAPPPPPAAAAPAPATTPAAVTPSTPMVPAGLVALMVSARFGRDPPGITGGLHWRIYPDKPDQNGAFRIVREERAAAPIFVLPPGGYVVHVSFGLASATKRVQLRAETVREVFEIQ